MKVCDLDTSKSLQELGYDGKFNFYYLPNGVLESVEYKILCGEQLYEDNDFIPAPSLDDVVHYLREEHFVMVVIEPFIYNGVIYNYMARIYSPSLFDKEPEHMNGLEILGSDGYYFDDYETAVESSIIKAIGIIKQARK